MRFMHWSFSDLMECPMEHLTMIVQTINDLEEQRIMRELQGR